MTRWTLRACLGAGLAATAMIFGTPIARAQTAIDPAVAVIATGAEASVPVPTLMEGALASTANSEVADQLFLHLAELGPTLMTSGDRAFEPALARSWTRRDSVTLVFDLDPRASWQDGAPVTAQDVVFTFDRARDPAVSTRLAGVLRRIVSVTAEGDRRVVFRFAYPYAEQLYDAVFHVAPIPEHLLGKLPPATLATSSYAQAPIGSGAYRWVRKVPGEYVELAANDKFFLGAPAIRRVFFRLATDAGARLNMVLSGEANLMDNIPPPRNNLDRVAAVPTLRVVPVPSPIVGFLLFNQRDPRDTSRPHPILADRDVRRAIGLALDRRVMVRATFGSAADVPYGPTSPLLWIGHTTPSPAQANVGEARRLLAARGWTDHDGDGILDRNGTPLSLTIMLPNTSGSRQQLALQAQEQLRQAGIHVELERLDFSVYNERRTRGAFDMDFSSTSQDPSPTGLSQGWSCQGGTNVAKYCDPSVDSLLEAAGRTTGHAADAWQAVLRRIESDYPAIFMYALNYLTVIDRRFTNVRIRPESLWLGLRGWTVAAPGARAQSAGY